MRVARRGNWSFNIAHSGCCNGRSVSYSSIKYINDKWRREFRCLLTNTYMGTCIRDKGWALPSFGGFHPHLMYSPQGAYPTHPTPLGVNGCLHRNCSLRSRQPPASSWYEGAQIHQGMMSRLHQEAGHSPCQKYSRQQLNFVQPPSALGRKVYRELATLLPPPFFTVPSLLPFLPLSLVTRFSWLSHAPPHPLGAIT